MLRVVLVRLQASFVFKYRIKYHIGIGFKPFGFYANLKCNSAWHYMAATFNQLLDMVGIGTVF